MNQLVCTLYQQEKPCRYIIDVELCCWLIERRLWVWVSEWERSAANADALQLFTHLGGYFSFKKAVWEVYGVVVIQQHINSCPFLSLPLCLSDSNHLLPKCQSTLQFTVYFVKCATVVVVFCCSCFAFLKLPKQTTTTPLEGLWERALTHTLTQTSRWQGMRNSK